MSMKEFKKRISQTKEQQRKKDIARGYINKSNKSIKKLINTIISTYTTISSPFRLYIKKTNYNVEKIK